MDHGAKSIAASTSEWLVMIKSGPPSIVALDGGIQYLLLDIITSDQTIKPL